MSLRLANKPLERRDLSRYLDKQALPLPSSYLSSEESGGDLWIGGSIVADALDPESDQASRFPTGIVILLSISICAYQLEGLLGHLSST